ncbi:YraN family protein [Planctomycetota bacterium]|nr:YraN family protein [Planctomycetota bacterium]
MNQATARNCGRFALTARFWNHALMYIIELIKAAVKSMKPAPIKESGRSGTRAVGDKAEDFALAFLRKERGFKLIEQSMSDEDGELDLVGRVKKFEGLVVVEVRARKVGGLKTPFEAVNHSKQVKVVQTADRLLRRAGYHEILRYDVVGVWLDDQSNPTKAEHYPNAFDRSVMRKKRD